MNRKIIGVTVGSPLPKPNLMQNDPKKGDYVKGKEEFLKQADTDLTGYATEEFVRNQIAEAELGGGDNVLIVTCENQYTSHNYDDIKTAYDAGKFVALKKSDTEGYYTLSLFSGNLAFFSYSYPIQNTYYGHAIFKSAYISGRNGARGKVEFYDYSSALPPSGNLQDKDKKILAIQQGAMTWEPYNPGGDADISAEIEEALEQAKASGEFDGKDGQDGKDGADGKTPVKGEDYFTEEDQQELVEAVIEQLPENNMFANLPVFDVNEMGMPAITLDGTLYECECDTTELSAALDRSIVRIRGDINDGTKVIKGEGLFMQTMHVTDGVHQAVVRATMKFSGDFYDFRLIVEPGIIYLSATPDDNSADVSAEIEEALEQAKASGEFDGYSPVRGTDYWTDADIAEIKSYVDDAILGGVW